MNKKIKVILQARTGSKRLYGKVLLPICGQSLITLCWKRIKDIKFDIIVAIPKDKEDNKLAKILKKKKIKFFRGERDNVLSRFKKITLTMNPEDIIIRVTADNPIVDSFFLNKLVSEFIKKKFKYLSSHDNVIYSPFGLQAEVFRVKFLREKLPVNKYNLEHVTPAIRNKYKSNKKIKIKNLKNCSNLRVTIDNKGDYERIKEIFNASLNKYKENYINLLNNYKKRQKKINNQKLN